MVQKRHYKIIIIGAGPGGVSLAAELINGGMSTDDIAVLEKADKESWVMRTLYAEQKLVTANFKGLEPVTRGVMKFHNMNKREALEVLSETIDKYNINVFYESNVYKIEKKNGAFVCGVGDQEWTGNIAAVGIGIFGKPNKPSYPIPKAIKELCHFDVTSQTIKNSKVMVVGMGDSASEYVQFLIDDNEILMCSRRVGENRMNPENKAHVDQFLREGMLTLLEPANITELAPEEGGKIRVKFQERDDEIVDRMIYAIGGTTPMNFLKVAGMEFDEKDRPVMRENFETTMDNLFLLGDLANGMEGGSIVLAFNTSYDISKEIINRY